MFSMMATVQLSTADWKRSTGSLSAWKEKKNIDFFPSVADPDPDPSIISKNSKKNLDSYCFVTSL
jgi:hypothetical protein